MIEQRDDCELCKKLEDVRHDLGCGKIDTVKLFSSLVKEVNDLSLDEQVGHEENDRLLTKEFEGGVD